MISIKFCAIMGWTFYIIGIVGFANPRPFMYIAGGFFLLGLGGVFCKQN